MSASTGIDMSRGGPSRMEEVMPQEDASEWYVGFDWASEKHRVCLLDRTGRVVGERDAAHDGAAEICIARDRARQLCLRQIRIRHGGADEVGGAVPDRDAFELALAGSLREEAVAQIGIEEIGAGEVAALEIGAGQIAAGALLDAAGEEILPLVGHGAGGGICRRGCRDEARDSQKARI